MPFPKSVNTEKKTEKKTEMSQYNASFNLYYDVVLKELADFLYQNDITEKNSKYGLAYYSILRTLFDYADEVIEDFPYTQEQLVSLIEEHEKLKIKFEQKLLALVGKNEEKALKVMSEIER